MLTFLLTASHKNTARIPVPTAVAARRSPEAAEARGGARAPGLGLTTDTMRSARQPPLVGAEHHRAGYPGPDSQPAGARRPASARGGASEAAEGPREDVGGRPQPRISKAFLRPCSSASRRAARSAY